MKHSLKLNNDISVDLEKLIEGGMVILANSGGGKSYLIRRIAEQAVDKVQTIIIDPEGEFSSLRQKYDFILAGKDADVPAEPRSAALLATKLLELNKSAVIDLYELHPQERQRFVKLFCDALVNCPKDLYHPVLIILDEAHEYVPEGKPSEATWAVESLASKGRKRGQRLILASQRISKLSKNAAAECNNKLIGRASQDIDMKRAGDELGFSKENLKDLRQLKPGEFFAFGPAISDEIIKLKVGEVKTAHAKVGYKGVSKIPPASDVIKKVLAGLKDLPKEAEKEAKTVAELKKENADLKRMNTNLLKNPFQKDMSKEEMDRLIAQVEKKLNSKFHEEVVRINKEIKKIGENVSKAKALLPDTFPQAMDDETVRGSVIHIENENFYKRNDPVFQISKTEIKDFNPFDKAVDGEKTFGRCPRLILSYLSAYYPQGKTKTQVAVATGYSQNSGGFNNSISELSAAGLIVRESGSLRATREAPVELLDVMLDVSLEKWLPKLGACAKKIWELMLAHHTDETWEKAAIANETGYSFTSGGFNNSLSELSALGLIERLPGGLIRINPEIINL